MADPSTPPTGPESAGKQASRAPRLRRKSPVPAEVEALAPPGLLGRLDPDQREALLAAVEWQRNQPPNPDGLGGPTAKRAPKHVEGHSWPGDPSVPGPLRVGVTRNRVCRTYLEEGIMVLHVRERRSLRETAELLGYSYRHVVVTWRAMRLRALSEEGSEAPREVRQFLLHHLEACIETASERMAENAAYGAVLVRACEALKEIEGLDSAEERDLSIDELAEEVRGRSPLLLETVAAAEEAEKAGEGGEGGLDGPDAES